MKSSLTSLPTELLGIILDDLRDFPHSIQALALTYKRLSSFARPLVNRHRTIALSSKVPKIVKSWLRSPITRTETRHLTVTRRTWPDKKNKAKEDAAAHAALVKLISRLERLKTLCWNLREPLPLAVLDAIHRYHAQAALSIRHFVRADPDARQLDDLERALSVSPALGGLWESVDVASLEHPACEAFREIVMRAPNIRDVVSAAFDTTELPICGWSAGEWQRRQTVRHETKQRLLAQFPKDLRPTSSVRSFSVSGPQASLGEWEKTIIPRNLERIAIDLVTFPEDTFQRMLEMMPMLKEISVNFPRWMQGIEDRRLRFGTASQMELDHISAYKHSVTSTLTACRPLVSLCLIQWMLVVDLREVLTHHGNTLKTLNLHMRQKQFTYGEDSRTMISIVDLGHIKEHCSNLTELSIDFKLASANPAKSARDDILDCLSLMRLQRIHLYIGRDLGWSLESAITEAPSVRAFVLETWSHILQALVRPMHAASLVSLPAIFILNLLISDMWHLSGWGFPVCDGSPEAPDEMIAQGSCFGGDTEEYLG